MKRQWRLLRGAAHGIAALLLLACAPLSVQAADDMPATRCSSWADLTHPDHGNREPSNLGCTNRRNLEQMVEDKRDLEQGRPLGPADAERESLAVKNYEEGHVKQSSSGTASPGLTIGPAAPAQGSQ
jgi:type IV pilus biogenesis protein CpaD/CtpE